MRYSLTLPESVYNEATAHLFAAQERQEEALFLLCGISRTDAETRLLARSVDPIAPAALLSQSKTHVSIPSQAFLPVLKKAAERNLCVVLVHSHPEGAPAHSGQDDREEAALFSTAYNRIHDPRSIHASVIFSSPDLPVGRIWLDGRGTAPLDPIRVTGDRFRFFMRGGSGTNASTAYHDRDVRAFGPVLLPLLRALTVGVIGAGGTGSAVIEQLVRLGVGRLIISDPQTIEKSNISRVYGSGASNENDRKVDVAKQNAERIGLGTRVEIIDKAITYQSALKRFRDADVIFGCTDDEWGRSLLGLFAIEYCIPVIDMAAKIDSCNGTIRSVVGRVTVLKPGSRCLFCRNQISPDGVRAEMLEETNPDEAAGLRRQRYAREIPDPAPAVVAFTTATAALAVSEFLNRLTGFKADNYDETILRFDQNELHRPGAAANPACHCQDPARTCIGDRRRFLDQTWRAE